MRSSGLVSLALLVALGSGACSSDGPRRSPTDPSPTAPATGSNQTVGTTVATGLDVPWGLAFLPGGSALMTLRDRGQVIRVRPGSTPMVVGIIPGVVPDGEGGLLGIAVSPEFASDRRVFLYLTTATDNRIERFTLRGTDLRADGVILSGIPKADHHDGGRIAFGPDGYLYAGTGDAGDSSRSQDPSSLGGKILRIDQSGTPPPDNPVPGSPVWSLGHRNVEGLAWDRAGRMFASEFGQNTWDELNLIHKGGNYGWPRVEGRAGNASYIDPLTQWRTSDASPSGLAIGPDGAAYLAALAGQGVWRVPLQGSTAGAPQKLLDGRLGRIRTIAQAADARLWIVTSNTFRGAPRPGDDRMIAMTLTQLRG